MKALFTAALAAALAAAAAARSHHHLHDAAKRHSNHLERRVLAYENNEIGNELGDGDRNTASFTNAVANAQEGKAIKYVLNGKTISAKEAAECLKNNTCALPPGASSPDVPRPPTSRIDPTRAATSSPPQNAPPSQYAPPSQNAPPPPPPPPSAATANQATYPGPPAPDTATHPSATGLNTDFPDGTLPCSEFPTGYGAIPLKHLDFNGWAGLQILGGAAAIAAQRGKLIADFATGIAGNNCGPNQYCSYACPPGYQKTQWPEKSQGETGQSIGGLFCNQQNILQLSRPDQKRLCQPTRQGPTVKNTLEKTVVICQTDYPGTEGMYIPTVVKSGQSVNLTNPNCDDAYIWDSKRTTAQFYVNNQGVELDSACVWGNAGDERGNWSPLVFGSGLAKDGNTYFSIKVNPLRPGAVANYNVQLKTKEQLCTYERGQVTSDNVGVDGNGCTLAFGEGSSGEYILY